MKQISEDGDIPSDGVLISVLRIFQQYHEILAWNYEWLKADEEIGKMVYQAIKKINPNAEVELYVYHQLSSWGYFLLCCYQL